ncbi:MAG: hypothetical protein ACOYXC_19630 [Candidatus Rifleibacteriota bacterium]
MKDCYNLAFADVRGELHWFSLASTALIPDNSDGTFSAGAGPQPGTGTESDPSGRSAFLKSFFRILILPASAGLPFQIDLSFDDPVKISRVIPQLAADHYAEIDETWLFSWSVSFPPVVEPCEASAKHGRNDHEREQNFGTGKFLVSGIAFPPEFKQIVSMSEHPWRLAIPDFLLLPTGRAFKTSTPAASYVAIFSEDGRLSRIIADAAVPMGPILAAAGGQDIEEFDFASNSSKIFDRLQGLLDNSHNYDLSGYQQMQTKKALQVSLISLAALIAGLIFLGHLFLWIECRLHESAADRTRQATAQAFSSVFPGIPMVDAVSQIRRKISDAQNSLQEAGSVPNIPWLQTLQLASASFNSRVKLLKLVVRADGFRFQGLAADFTSLENFRKLIEASGMVDKVSTPESRRNEDQVLFALEARWKN